MNRKLQSTSNGDTASPAENKHQSRSANTRELFICAAQKLYAQRSIDSVSLGETTVASGQKNRYALQYHFGNREGRLQAILDRHAGPVHDLRRGYISQASPLSCSQYHVSFYRRYLPGEGHRIDK